LIRDIFAPSFFGLIPLLDLEPIHYPTEFLDRFLLSA